MWFKGGGGSTNTISKFSLQHLFLGYNFYWIYEIKKLSFYYIYIKPSVTHSVVMD